MSHSIVSPEVSFGVPVCNSFASLSDECASPAVFSNSSDEESKKQRCLGGSDHSSYDLEISADLTMHLSSRQEFPLAKSGDKFERQREKTHGGKWASIEAYSVSITSQQHPLQPQQSSTQKPHPPNATPTTKPADQIITMSSRRKQSTSPSLQQSKEIEKPEASQKFYASDYNSQAPSSQHHVAMEIDTVTRDNREAQFHYPPSPNRFKQLPPSFQ